MLERFFDYPSNTSQNTIDTHMTHIFPSTYINPQSIKLNNDVPKYDVPKYPTKLKYISKICSGSASKLYKVQDTDGRYYILKKINKSEEWVDELLLLKKISGKTKYLLNYIDHFETYLYVYIIFEYFDIFNLHNHIIMNLPYSEFNARILLQKMLYCIKECHDLGIAHLDIKFDNFIYKRYENQFDYDIILIDFGHSCYEHNFKNYDEMEATYGTSLFLSPEGVKSIRSYKSDIWSFGVCAFTLITGYFPYVEETEKEMYIKIMKDKINKKAYKKLSPVAKDLVDKCLQKDAKDRPTVDELLKHDFFRLN